MTIWDTPRGRSIQDVWMKNVFPSQLTEGPTAPTEPTAAAPKKRTKAAVELAARAQETRLPHDIAAQAVDQHHGSYHGMRHAFWGNEMAIANMFSLQS